MENDNFMFDIEKQFEIDNIDISKKMLLGVSGGPDSMFLLNLLKNKNIIVAHVNYNKRETSKVDEEIVVDFCKKNNIKYFVLNLKKHNEQGNFQNIARIQRYEFFKKIYDEEKCDYLILAHHKDDFLETAIMQENSCRKVLYYGIKPKNFLFKMNVYRPLIFAFWKSEILNLCNQDKLPYALDYTNDLDIYTRNAIRNKLKEKLTEEKTKLLNSFIKRNVENKELETLIQEKFNEWRQNEFNCNFLKNNNLWKNLIYKFINTYFLNVELSSSKMEGIYQFIISNNRTAQYKLDDKNILFKKKNVLKISK